MKNKVVLFSVCSIVLAVCIIASGCTSTNAQTSAQSTSPTVATLSQTPNPTTSSETLIPTSAPTPAQTAVAATAGTPANSLIVVALNSAQKKTTLGTYKPKAGNIFLILDVTIKNSDKNEDFVYSDTSFTLYDKPNQKKYSPVTSQVAGSLTSPLTTGRIPMKSEKTGQIVFPVLDMGSEGYKFTVTDSAGTEIASFTKFDVS